MKNPEIINILERSQNGEYCTVKEWDVKRIPKAVREKLEEYQLKGTCDPENPVNMDGELADRFYKAGYEMALELGMLCETTDRIIKVSEGELIASLEKAPAKITVGTGEDATVMKARKPSDPYPTMFGASLGITTSEEVWPALTEGIARERAVDMLEGGSLKSIYGLDVIPDAPSETLVGFEQAKQHVEIRVKAGRPGMGGIGQISAVTEYGQFGGYGIPGALPITDLSLILFPSELKVNYQTLHKVVHTLNVGGMIFAGSPAMIGGMPGPPEGAVLSCIACALLQYPILQADVGGGEIYDIRYLSNVNRDGIWALSVTHQALSRNTDLLTHGIANQVSGPGTKELLYETIVGVSTIAASGAAFSTGPRSAGGKLEDYLTPLECRFCAEVSHAASALSLEKVNEIAKILLPKYEDSIKDPHIGKIVHEVYDLEKFQPKPEWQQVYDEVKQEAIELGLPL
ncbi:MAG: monomethylamine:corrinoid methyltransferase [Anaerolineales bacterium]